MGKPWFYANTYSRIDPDFSSHHYRSWTLAIDVWRITWVYTMRWERKNAS